VHHGRLFILLYLLGARGEWAVAIDLFSRQESQQRPFGAGDLERFKKNLDATWIPTDLSFMKEIR